MDELTEFRQDQIEIKNMLKLLIPHEFTISHVAKLTGKSRQAVREYVLTHGEPDVDFWKKNGKIYLSEKVALQYINARR